MFMFPPVLLRAFLILLQFDSLTITDICLQRDGTEQCSNKMIIALTIQLIFQQQQIAAKCHSDIRRLPHFILNLNHL